VRPMPGRCLCLGAAAAATPLLLVLLAARLSGWFNPLTNALSDLGHATRSPVAPIFNLGLSLGGFLLALSGVLCAYRRSRLVGATLVASGFLLNLVGVFDEVYGRLHYYVSVAFFLSLAALLVEYSAVARGRLRRVLGLMALAAGALSWLLHMVYGLPRGAAVPELVSILVSLPFYLDFLAGADRT